MNGERFKAFTKAIDSAIARVANSELQMLQEESSDQDFIRGIHEAFKAFGSFTKGAMPEYNAWEALLYSTWYQPGHINLAYSSIDRIARGSNPIAQGQGELFVSDFGCGQLSLQFAPP